MFGKKKNTLKEVGKLSITFLLGALSGAAAAILLTPKSGREMRKEIRTGFDHLADKAAEQAVHLGEEIKEVIGKVKAA